MNFPFDEKITLENDRVLIEPLQIGDEDKLLKIAITERTLLQYSPVEIHSQELLEKYIANWVKQREEKSRYPFIIYDKVNKAFAGSTSFMNISNANDRLEIGSTWIAKDFQRTGLNRNCKFLLLEYVFEKLGVVRVEFLTDERNLASRTAIEKIGGKYEGIIRKHVLMTNGWRRNSVCYSILDEEWPEVKKAYSELLSQPVRD